jgi:LacI family transcriptional regulator
MRHHPLLVELHAQNVPMVLVNRRVDGLNVPSVVADDERGIQNLVAHLAGLGHTRIAQLAGPNDTSTGLVRERAFQAAVREAHLAEDRALTVRCKQWSVEAGADATHELLASGLEFTALVGGNDLLALGALGVLAGAGLSCPHDISVTGFNDMPFLDLLSPGLTTVRVPHYDIGAEAARLFLECLDEPARVPRSVVLPTELVVRSSTATVAAGQSQGLLGDPV